MGTTNFRFYAILAISAMVHATVAGMSVWLQNNAEPADFSINAQQGIEVDFVELENLEENSPPEPDPTPGPVQESAPPQEQIIAEPTPEVAAAPTPQRKIKQPRTRPARATVVEARPDYLINPPPPYPVSARRRGLQGTVLLRVNVSETGNVASLRISRSSGYDLFDRAALNAVRKWKFSPRRLGGIATPGIVEVPIQFKIK
jgi:protein TonB